jgi:hypothetical protein
MKYVFTIQLIFFLLYSAVGQPADSLGEQPLLRWNFNETGSTYLQVKGMGQVWFRYSELNTPSMIDSEMKDAHYDITLRRWRVALYGQLTERLFLFAKVGDNNFQFDQQSPDKPLIHDASVEYEFIPGKFTVGGGLTGWAGLLRFASPDVNSILSLDAPIYQQATPQIKNKNARGLSLFAKGQVNRFDYRLVVQQTRPTKPYDEITSPDIFRFNENNTTPQFQGYIKYMFDHFESDKLPYQEGTYLSHKPVFDLGMGFVYQKSGTHTIGHQGEELKHDIMLIGADLFIEESIANDISLNLYAAISYYDFGDNYIYFSSVDNPIYSGKPEHNLGNAFPTIGTGSTFYLQSGLYVGHIQPFVSLQHSNYQRLNSPMVTTEWGLNWLLFHEHHKITLAYQTRPYFAQDDNQFHFQANRRSFTLQYQLSF